ncbi:AAA family ATPase [Planomonospora alba]|uniref:AAA family ATPase n=1 Tax=Planomonospora alba TaxID=161354 RepID=A0ABP6MP44_9ACTN
MADAVRIAPLFRCAMEVLAEAGRALPRREVMDEVHRRFEFAPEDERPDRRGRPRWQTHLGWKISEAAAVGWVTRQDGWLITEAGLQALKSHAGDELHRELGRQYRLKRLSGQRSRYTDPRWGVILDALALLEPESWTSYGDLAELSGISPQSVGGFLAENPLPSGHRVLRTDGRVSPEFRWADENRTDDPREVLKREGLEFDEFGRASQAQRVTADDFRQMLSDMGAEPATRRAWLVRGSSVDGRDLVPVWLHKESVSLAGASLRPISPPVPRDELRAIVEDDYQHKSYAAREVKLAEFDAFCNRMRPGDYVLTTSQGKTYVGRITGEAEFVHSPDQRSNLRRPVEWLNPTGPVPFAHLPQPLPAKLQSQADVVELTENLAAVEELLSALGLRGGGGPVKPPKELSFPEVSQGLADDLFTDREQLQRLADLLEEDRQLILYGPPGTGKTYIARKLAGELAEPGAVKLVQFHPSYTYEDFFEGFRPVQRADGQLAFELRPGPFRQLVEAARLHPSDPYILIIDEINRANLAKVFGELYFLLEYRDDTISLLYSAESDFMLPPNVFVIGTMNTTDRSIALVDAAMRRRFRFVELHPARPPVKGLLGRWLADRREKDELAVHNLDAPEVLDELNSRIEDHDLAIGPSYLMKPVIYRREDGLQTVWETSILPLLAEYHYGSPPAVFDRYRLKTLRQAIAVRHGAEEAQ